LAKEVKVASGLMDQLDDLQVASIASKMECRVPLAVPGVNVLSDESFI
jgi:hypothetical protein